jgi:hypothetical protein
MGMVMRTVGLLVGTGLGGIAWVAAGGAASAVVEATEGAGVAGPEASGEASEARGPVLSSHPATQAASANARIAWDGSIDARLMVRF